VIDDKSVAARLFSGNQVALIGWHVLRDPVVRQECCGVDSRD
jgi:hypothetical protein